jgi:hypothetical protein
MTDTIKLPQSLTNVILAIVIGLVPVLTLGYLATAI